MSSLVVHKPIHRQDEDGPYCVPPVPPDGWRDNSKASLQHHNGLVLASMKYGRGRPGRSGHVR